MTSEYLRSDGKFLLSHCLFQPYWTGVITHTHTHTHRERERETLSPVYFSPLRSKGNGELKKEVVGRKSVLLCGSKWSAVTLVLQPRSALQGSEWLRPEPRGSVRFGCWFSTPMPESEILECACHLPVTNWTSSKLNQIQRWILVSINSHKIILWLFIEGIGLESICSFFYFI